MIYLIRKEEINILKKYYVIQMLLPVANTSLLIARCGYLSCGYFLLVAYWLVLIVFAIVYCVTLNS